MEQKKKLIKKLSNQLMIYRQQFSLSINTQYGIVKKLLKLGEEWKWGGGGRTNTKDDQILKTIFQR